ALCPLAYRHPPCRALRVTTGDGVLCGEFVQRGNLRNSRLVYSLFYSVGAKHRALRCNASQCGDVECLFWRSAQQNSALYTSQAPTTHPIFKCALGWFFKLYEFFFSISSPASYSTTFFCTRLACPNPAGGSGVKIALLGTRGVPANYGGFETCAEELGARLVERGHSVSVYCRTHHVHYSQPYYRGMHLVRLPTIRNKYLDTITHATIACCHALTQQYDVVLMFIAGNSPLSFVPRL